MVPVSSGSGRRPSTVDRRSDSGVPVWVVRQAPLNRLTKLPGTVSVAEQTVHGDTASSVARNVAILPVFREQESYLSGNSVFQL